MALKITSAPKADNPREVQIWREDITDHLRNHIGVNKTPSSATDTGTQWDIAIDANYIYVCVADNTWKRVAIATW
ncbi:MAG: hypothetical protein ACXABY_13025 [Candidatus Thorarchaeota archaeon]|jgi:hypothetical protein